MMRQASALQSQAKSEPERDQGENQDAPVRPFEATNERIQFLRRDRIAAFVPSHESVTDAHGLVDTEDDEQESECQLNGELIAHLLCEQLPIHRLELRQLKSAGKDQDAERAHLQRVITLEFAGEKSGAVLVCLDGGRRGQEDRPKSDNANRTVFGARETPSRFISDDT